MFGALLQLQNHSHLFLSPCLTRRKQNSQRTTWGQSSLSPVPVFLNTDPATYIVLVQ